MIERSTELRTCMNCEKRFRRWTLNGRTASGSLDMARIDPEGYFCTLRCAATWAVVQIEAGEFDRPGETR